MKNNFSISFLFASFCCVINVFSLKAQAINYDCQPFTLTASKIYKLISAWYESAERTFPNPTKIKIPLRVNVTEGGAGVNQFVEFVFVCGGQSYSLRYKSVKEGSPSPYFINGCSLSGV